MNESNDDPTILSASDIDKFVQDCLDGKHDPKPQTCFKCGTTRHFLINYGHRFNECDECYFARFPKEQVQAFYRSFLE